VGSPAWFIIRVNTVLVDRDTSYVLQRVCGAWDHVRAGMERMYQASNSRPSDGYEIFVPDNARTAGEVKLTVHPVIFNLPERANRRDTNLYIALSGWLSFEKAGLRNPPLRTRGFGTKVGYFRAKAELLEHVYGAHYDIEEAQAGHPVFHSQMGPEMDLGEKVKGTYRLGGHLKDSVSPILRNVRIPTAQMDVFSVILQICADHLIFEASGQEVKDAFAAMVQSCGFFTGAAHRMDFLNRGASCYRSTHWYSSPPAG
jgi:hypothetical protein